MTGIKQNEEPDEDSMMALEALMKIRSDAFPESPVKRSTGSAETLSAFKTPAQSRPNMQEHRIPVSSTHLVCQTEQVTSSSMTNTCQFTIITPLTPDSRPHSAIACPPLRFLCTPPLKTEHGFELPDEPAVRPEKIEAALRSKPQRGKKRDNLSEEERLELTRTRNREHAKSTRVRKKARYEELINKEKMYEKFQAFMDLQDARNETIRTFIERRDRLLSSTSKEQGNACVDILEESFAFKVQGMLDSLGNVDAISMMTKFEDIIQSKCAKKYGANTNLSYHIDQDTVAFNKAGVALAELSIISKCAEGKPGIVISALTKWTFGQDSEKLISLQWTTTNDPFAVAKSLQDPPNHEERPPDSRLALQKIYPSVVSLDPHIGEPRPEGDLGMSLL